MEQSIHDYLDEIDVLIEEAEKDIERRLLETINIDELLQDPEGYLLALGDAFLSRHIGSLEKATTLGGNHASDILKAI